MIQNTFEAKEVVLGKLFSNDYLFRMPVYQRSYSWTPEETEEILNDLLGAMVDEGGVEPYFLGSIVLIARPNSSVHEVVDGQQRLMSRSVNSRSRNYDFDRKKKYFQKGGVSGFALTTQVVNETTWTPRVLERRQRMLIDTLKTEWGLS